ncbi:MAG: nitrate reductase associated protein [Parvibaculum sp.]|uniref:nitrate reductase associated protein n=1 Tax=Parvibaculum sp. TaxID=2024848 RepID=UPI002600159D|nr:nitrate reductase associated protein [Parvibaculum sp.]MCE9650482.1 nitrate reductase associated protein [Parvibaculum sp.]
MIFNFELDFAGSLRCIPLAVRFNLDHCGIKLSLKQWNRFSHEEKVDLVERLCSTEEEIARYRTLVVALIRERSGEEPDEIAVEASPAWADLSGVPSRLETYVRDLGMTPPSLALWRRLSPLQRFALYKLTRPGHKNENLVPALDEFNLTASPPRRASRR